MNEAIALMVFMLFGFLASNIWFKFDRQRASLLCMVHVLMHVFLYENRFLKKWTRSLELNYVANDGRRPISFHFVGFFLTILFPTSCKYVKSNQFIRQKVKDKTDIKKSIGERLLWQNIFEYMRKITGCSYNRKGGNILGLLMTNIIR